MVDRYNYQSVFIIRLALSTSIRTRIITPSYPPLLQRYAINLPSKPVSQNSRAPGYTLLSIYVRTRGRERAHACTYARAHTRTYVCTYTMIRDKIRYIIFRVLFERL